MTIENAFHFGEQFEESIHFFSRSFKQKSSKPSWTLPWHPTYNLWKALHLDIFICIFLFIFPFKILIHIPFHIPFQMNFISNNFKWNFNEQLSYQRNQSSRWRKIDQTICGFFHCLNIWQIEIDFQPCAAFCSIIQIFCIQFNSIHHTSSMATNYSEVNSQII